MAKRKTKIVYRDKPPALRPVLVKGGDLADVGGVAGIILHLMDAKSGEPCDVVFPAFQWGELKVKVDRLVDAQRKDGARRTFGRV